MTITTEFARASGLFARPAGAREKSQILRLAQNDRLADYFGSLQWQAVVDACFYLTDIARIDPPS